MKKILSHSGLLAAALSLVSVTLHAQTTVTYVNGENATVPRSTTVLDPLILTIASGQATENGVISGAGSVSKTGDGLLRLTGSNSYLGGTTISAGMLEIAGNDVLGTGALTITGGGIRAGGEMRTLSNSLFTSGSFVLGRSTNFTGTTTLLGNTTIIASNPDGPANADSIFGGPIVGNYGVTLAEGPGGLGAGAIVFDGSNSYTGGTMILSGALQLGSGGTSGSITGNVASNGSLRFNRSDAATFSGTISGSGSVSQIGAGTTIFTANHTYTGTTFISGGALQLGDGGTTGSIASTSIANNSSLIFNRSDAVSYAGTITGTGGITKLGANTLTLSGSNSYSGTTTINAGSVSLGNANALGTGSVWMNGGTLDLNGLANVSGGSMRLGGGATLLNSSTTSTAGFAGNIENYGTLGGAGDMILSGNITRAGTLGGSGHLTIAGSMGGGLSKVGTGTATLLGNSSLTSTSVDGGVLSISGGSVSSQGDVLVGGAGGRMVVTNGGSLTTSTSDRIYVGQSGTGTMLLDGGKITTDYLYIGTNPQSVGSVTIASGTLRTNVFPEIGTQGTGSLTITGGLLDAGGQAIFDMGYWPTGHGILTVTGGTVTGIGFLTVGNSGTGTLLVNGGLLLSLNGSIGGGTMGTSIATVSSGTWQNTNLTVNRGTLNVTDTGVLRSNRIYIYGTGTINFGTGGAAGIIDAPSIANNGMATLNFNHTGLATFTPTLSGTLRLNKLGSGTTAVTSNSIVSGTTTISQGTLQFGNGGTTGLITGTAIIDNGTLAFNRSDAVTYATVISGSGALAQNGSGLLTLTGINSYTGSTVLNAGQLSVSSFSNIGYGAIVMNGGGFQWASGSILDISSRLSAQGSGGTFDTNGNNVTFASAFSGTGALVKAGPGTLAVTGSNSHNGTFTISRGALQIGSGGSTGSLASSAILNSSTLVLNRSGVAAYGGNISGSGLISQIGTGTFTLSGSNSYTGAATISAGQLRLGSAYALGGGDLTVNNGSLDLNGYSGTVSTLIGNSAGLITSGATGAATLTVGGIFSTSTYAGVIQDGSGTVSLVKLGFGILTLTGNNTYTGTTTISGGVLEIGGSLASSSIVNNAVATFNAGGATTYAGVISGTGRLTQFGTGTFTLTGANTYTGSTRVLSSLQIGNGGTSGSLASNLIDNRGAVAFNRSNAAAYAGVISGDGSLVQLGTGTLTLTGANTYTGATTISSGVLQIGDGGTAGSISSGSIVNNAALAFSRSDATSYAGAISGTGSVAQLGTGTLTLSGSNSYTGGTRVDAGTLRLGNARALGTNALTINGAGTLDLNGNNLTVSSLSGASQNAVITSSAAGSYVFTASQSANTTFAGVLQNGSGTLSLVMQSIGTGTLTLTGENTFTGTTSIIASTLQIGNGGATGSLTGPAVLYGGTLVLNRSGTAVYAGAISGNGSVTQLGSGTFTLSGSSTYAGPTIISAGQLRLDSDYALGSSQLAVYNGSLDLNGRNATVTGLSGSNTGRITNGATSAATLTVNANFGATFAGVIEDGAGTVSLVKQGSDMLTLTGNNTYTGATIISGGILQIGGGGTTGSLASNSIVDNSSLVFARSNATTYAGVISGTGHVSKFGTGILTLTGNNTYTGTTAIALGTLQIGSGGATGSIASGAILNSGTLAFNRSDASTYAGVISGTGRVTQLGTGVLTLSGNNTYTGTTTISAGALQLGNGGATGSIASASVRNSGTLAFNRGDATSYAGVISGTGRVAQIGSGALTLSGSNSYTGGTTITSGTLIKAHNNALGAGAVVVDGGVFQIGEGVTANNAVILAGGEYNRALTGGASLANAIDATSSFAGGAPNTTAKVLQGTLATTGTLATSFSATSTALNDEIRLSDVYHFDGTDSSVFVLELSMTSVDAGSILGWRDPGTGLWVNAVLGNTGDSTMFFAGDGAYEPLTDFHLGTYGVDTVNGTVWAVVNHNSDFAIIPEPSTFALLALGGLGCLAIRRRRKGI